MAGAGQRTEPGEQGGPPEGGPPAEQPEPGKRGRVGQQLEPGERGALRIADRVVAKIAAQAAREALPTGVPAGGDAPSATVSVRRGSARVWVALDLDYPCDIGAECAEVRRQVTQRVEALAGLAVPRVTVQVERLHSAWASRSAAQGRTR
ncbi:Asp23/Gls24 family envelope stress response protein [Streptomyces sp. NPDC002851]